ncbi:MAG TPA: hypothetical protein VFZ25_11745, partial [Chloroflexota bacterium]|nr:hypothetical protein [Chloroflexota bacterium]
PGLRHRRYAALDERDCRIVNWLGGIIRVADGLDRGHDAAVQYLAITATDERLEIRASSRNDRFRLRADAPNAASRAALVPTALALPRGVPRLRLDVAAAQRKSDLLARALGRVVSIEAIRSEGGTSTVSG